jgi:hypothetical protein
MAASAIATFTNARSRANSTGSSLIWSAICHLADRHKDGEDVDLCCGASKRRENGGVRSISLIQTDPLPEKRFRRAALEGRTALRAQVVTGAQPVHSLCHLRLN